MYRAAYQRELSRWLGVRWDEPDRWGNRAIVGMPEELAITGQVARQYAVYASVTQPGSPPGAILAAWYGSWPWFLDLALALVFTPLLFPTGTTGTGTGLIFTSVAWNHQAGRTLHTGAAG